MMLSFAAMAQQQRTVNVQGIVKDYETNDPVPQATIQWLQLPDSAFVEGVVTFNNGHFELQKRVHTGNYLLKVSYIGYGTQELPFAVDKRTETIKMDTIKLKSDAIMLKEAIIEAQIAEVQMVEDTLMFNAEAFRVPEGSAIEELLKKMPGIEIEDGGVIKVNGRTVDKLLVSGEEFFGNNRELTMKNLPANIVKRVKNYERKSDLSRETGIDDGEEEFVLDLEVKRNMMEGWIGNFDGAYGRPLRPNDFDIRDLYNGRIMMNRFERLQQYSIFANTGNTNGNIGLSQNTNAGFNMAKNFGENWRKNQYQYKVGGNVNFGTGGSHNENESSSETILNEMRSTFSNNWSTNANSNLRASGDFQFEWRPDSMTSLIIRPNFNYNTSASTSASRSATFNEDPYETIDAQISTRLIENIFFKNSPLHDGAMIVSRNRIKAAACLLPVSHNLSIPKHLGLRHRAALGISQESDSISIIVSEETGGISVAHKGEFKLDMSSEELEQYLTSNYYTD